MSGPLAAFGPAAALRAEAPRDPWADTTAGVRTAAKHVAHENPWGMLDLYLRDRELFDLALGPLTGWAP